jgi:pSer/pThr/pTyr-binding forkhead associated (FHA) protein
MDINLVLFRKDGSYTAFPLPSNVTVIGRRHACDLRIPLTPVSKRHCQLSCSGETMVIRDLGSRNGTYLNGNRIDEAEVKPGDYLQVGPLMFLIQIGGQPEEISPPKQLTKEVPKKEKPQADAKHTDTSPSSDKLEDIAELDESGSFAELNELDDLAEVDESDSGITDFENI